MKTQYEFVVKANWEPLKLLPTNFEYDKVMRPCVLEAQQFDLRVAIGKKFYDNELAPMLENGASAAVGELTVAAYQNILTAIQFAVMYFAYARYIKISKHIITRTGIVQKVNPHSEYIDRKELESIARDQDRKALSYIDDMIEYMEDNPSLYKTFLANRPNRTGRETSITFWTPETAGARTSDVNETGDPKLNGVDHWGIGVDFLIE